MLKIEQTTPYLPLHRSKLNRNHTTAVLSVPIHCNNAPRRVIIAVRAHFLNSRACVFRAAERNVLRVHADHTASGPIQLRRLRVHRVKRSRADDFSEPVDRVLAPGPAVRLPFGKRHAQRAVAVVVCRLRRR